MRLTRWFTFALAIATPAAALADDPDDDDRSTQTQQQKQQKQTKQASLVKVHVVPAIAGIEAADKAAGALYELAGMGDLDRKQAQSTVALARDATQLALTRAQSLDGLKGLSGDARAEADTATTKLRAAKKTIQQLSKRVSGPLEQEDMERIQEQTRSLHADLSEAESSVERVAQAYDVSTDLEFGG